MRRREVLNGTLLQAAGQTGHGRSAFFGGVILRGDLRKAGTGVWGCSAGAWRDGPGLCVGAQGRDEK